jgi:hypothetical protein
MNIQYLLSDLSSISGIELIRDEENEKLLYLIILIYDYLILKECLLKYFDLNQELTFEEVGKDEVNNAHPEIKLGMKIKSNESLLQNNYIGVSHLNCCTCSLLLEDI